MTKYQYFRWTIVFIQPCISFSISSFIFVGRKTFFGHTPKPSNVGSEKKKKKGRIYVTSQTDEQVKMS